ncbi:hypothetical protein ACP3WI_25185, partial [Salmonella enterica]
VVTRCDDSGVQVEIAGGLRLLADVDPQGVSPGAAVTLGLRAEQIREGLGDGQPLRGVVNLVEHLGEANFLYVTL